MVSPVALENSPRMDFRVPLDDTSPFTRSVIGILEDRAGSIDQGMPDCAGIFEQALQQVSNKNEKVGGQGISLPQFALTGNPWTRGAIDEEGGAGGLEYLKHPTLPERRESSRLHDSKQAAPIDRVECFGEIQFEHNCGFPPTMTALD